MAAQAWKVFNKAKKKIGSGTLILTSATHFRATLYTSASNFATLTLSVFGSLTNEVTSVAASYSSSGKAMTSVAWTVGASAKQYKYVVGNFFWSANAQISSIKGCVIWVSGASANARHVLATCSLTASQFNLAAGNRLTISINTSVFTMA
jgi:hypothetical protein